MSTLQFIDQQRLEHPIQQLCQVLGVVPSRYYAWRLAQVNGMVGKQEPAWETEMVAVFDHHKRRYGTRRLQAELRETGHRVGRQALRTGLRRHGREALPPKSFVPRTTDSTHGQRCAPNLLLDQPRPTQANRVWVSDITCLPLASGAWAYLCAFQDACTKHVVVFRRKPCKRPERATVRRTSLCAIIDEQALKASAPKGSGVLACAVRATWA